MSVDHLSETKAPVEERTVFLDVVPGMTVIVRCDYLVGETQDKDWWMGVCIWCEGGARDPSLSKYLDGQPHLTTQSSQPL